MLYTSAGICNAFLPNCSFVVHRWIAQKSMLFSNHDDDAGAGMQCIAQVVFMIDADADVDLPVCLLLMGGFMYELKHVLLFGVAF